MNKVPNQLKEQEEVSLGEVSESWSIWFVYIHLSKNIDLILEKVADLRVPANFPLIILSPHPQS
jgi:hypothetical protein